MLDKESYKKELVRMWDSVRHCDYKGEKNCHGIDCGRCPLNQYCSWCSREDVAYNAFEVIETVEKWSKEHPPKKYNVSQLEYDILKSYLDYKNHMTVDIADYFFEDGLLLSLLKKGYFKGATKEMLIKYYYNNCEVVDE